MRQEPKPPGQSKTSTIKSPELSDILETSSSATLLPEPDNTDFEDAYKASSDDRAKRIFRRDERQVLLVFEKFRQLIKDFKYNLGTSTYSYLSARSDMDEIVKAKAELGQAREAQLSCLHPDLAKLDTWAHQLRVVLSEVREKYHARYHNELEKDIP